MSFSYTENTREQDKNLDFAHPKVTSIEYFTEIIQK